MVLEVGKYGNNSIFEQHVPGGGPKLNDLLLDLGTDDTSWADGIGEVRAKARPEFTAHFATIDLRAALSRHRRTSSDAGNTMRLAS